MKNQLLIEVCADHIDLYLANPKGRADRYTRYRLAHLVKPFTDGGTRQNQDLWRLYEAYVYEKTDSDMTLALPYPIVNKGEWEAAIQVKDTPDFHGGYHGYELLKQVEAAADGKKLDLGVPQSLWAEEFTFLQESDLICQGTRSEVLAHHMKKYCFSDGVLRLEQHIRWEKSVPVTKAFLAMLPIRRTADDTDNGRQITDRVQVNGDLAVYDVSKIGHETPVSSKSSCITDFRSAKIWGETSGITAEMQVAGDFPPSNRFMVQNTPAYNKLYFSYAREYQTTVGEEWALTTEYEIY